MRDKDDMFSSDLFFNSRAYQRSNVALLIDIMLMYVTSALFHHISIEWMFALFVVLKITVSVSKSDSFVARYHLEVNINRNVNLPLSWLSDGLPVGHWWTLKTSDMYHRKITSMLMVLCKFSRKPMNYLTNGLFQLKLELNVLCKTVISFLHFGCLTTERRWWFWYEIKTCTDYLHSSFTDRSLHLWRSLLFPIFFNAVSFFSLSPLPSH